MATTASHSGEAPPGLEGKQQDISTIAPDSACDEPAPSAPGGRGKEAIATDASTGEQFDKVYGVRPKTTWHLLPAIERNVWQFVVSLDLCPEAVYRKRDPSAPPRGPPPVRPIWEENVFICTVGSIPLLVHAAWNYFVPTLQLNWATAWVMYHILFITYAKTLIGRLHVFMEKYGCLDEQNRGRDMIDDRHVNQLGRSIYIYTVFRSIGPFVLAWRGDMVNPLEGLSIYTLPKIALWQVALDFWFYLYHRSSHEFDCVWWIHRQHHATKHPTPILSIFADDFQECLEIFIIPALATLVTPKMSFAELYGCLVYTLYVEALGHSGIRADWRHPLLGWILRPLGMELAVEDHDLHHRFGKSGKNYGKQTRIWDRIFNTIGERIENVPN